MSARSRAGLACVCALLAGCQFTLPDGSPNPDPFRGFNEKMFWLNDKADAYFVEPVARGWDWVAPEPVQSSVENFFENLLSPVSFVSNLLQGKLANAGTETARFAINSTLGFGGLFDLADEWGIERRHEDLGQALGSWGVPPGPYLVLPFFGPSNARDAVGLAGNAYVSLEFYEATVREIEENAVPLLVVELENWRALHLEDIEKARERSFDWYVFVRNAYLQNRQALVDDHDAPDMYEPDKYEDVQPEEDDLYEIEDDLYEIDED